MPKYTTGRTLSIRLAIVLLCSFAPFGCAQGLRPTLPRLWGPDRITVQDATRGITGFVRREKKESAAANSQEPPARSGHPDVDSQNRQRGADVATAAPAGEKTTSMLAGLAAIVERRADRERSVIDPFTAASETSADALQQRPGTNSPPQGSLPPYPAAVENPFAGMMGTTAANNTAQHPKVTKNPFVEEFDSQLERLRASVDEEFSEVESPASQAARLSEARDHIGDLMWQAQQAIADGRLSDAAVTLESADELTSRMGVFFGPDEEQPGDLLRRVRDRMQEQQAARAAEPRVAERIESEANQRPAPNASNPFLPRAVAAHGVNRPQAELQQERPITEAELQQGWPIEVEAERPQDQLADRDSSPEEPRSSHADTPRPPVNSFQGVRIYPRGNRPEPPHENMIIDAANVPSRFPGKPLAPVEAIVPAGSDAESNVGGWSGPVRLEGIETGNNPQHRSASRARPPSLGNQADVSASSKSSVPAIDPATLGRLKQNDLLNFQK